MPVQQLLPQRQYFGPDDINVLSSALDEALRELKISDRTDPAARFLAKRIIQLAQQGERDPIRLREGAVEGVVVPAPPAPKPAPECGVHSATSCIATATASSTAEPITAAAMIWRSEGGAVSST